MRMPPGSLAELRLQIATRMHAESPWLTPFMHWPNGSILFELTLRYGERQRLAPEFGFGFGFGLGFGGRKAARPC
jgi:hypothetical protein